MWVIVVPFLLLVVALSVAVNLAVVLVIAALRFTLLCFREPWLIVGVLCGLVVLKLL